MQDNDGKQYDFAVLMFLINGSIFLDFVNNSRTLRYYDNHIALLGVLIITTLISAIFGHKTITGLLGGAIGIIAFAVGLLSLL